MGSTQTGRNVYNTGEGILYSPGGLRLGSVAGLWKRYALASQWVVGILRFYPADENGQRRIWGQLPPLNSKPEKT